MTVVTAVDACLRRLRGDGLTVVDDPAAVAVASTDWTGRFGEPAAAVVRPRSRDEVVAVVAAAAELGVALIPQGGNTGLVGGAAGAPGQVIVDLRRMDTIDEVDTGAGQLRADAGATVAAVDAAARAAGWRYGVDFAARDSATIGGTIATNAGGVRVMRFGMTRAQLVGIEAVLADGRVLERMDGLLKDNTGLDLAGLLCGSEGTLGIVTAARLRLVPVAAPTVTAFVGFESVASAHAAVGRLRLDVPGVEAIELVLEAGLALVVAETGVSPPFPLPPAALLVEAGGPPDPTAAMHDTLRALAGVTDVAVAQSAAHREALWSLRERHTECIARQGTPLKFDVTVPAPRLVAFVDGIRQTVAETAPEAVTWIFGHAADGNLHVNVTCVGAAGHDAVTAAVLGSVIDHGGSISAEHGIGRAKRDWLTADRGAVAVDAMCRIKRALDPQGILNPGVLYPGGIEPRGASEDPSEGSAGRSG